VMEAFALAREAGAVLPDDAHAQKLFADASGPVSIESTPAGAAVSYRQSIADGAWTSLGTTPIKRALVPRELLVWRLEKAGFAPVLRIWPLWNRNQTERGFSAVLDRDGALPAGMVRIPGGKIVLDFPGSARMPAVEIGDYFMDVNEVTNRDFKRFVDAGGYARSELWKLPFARAGRTVAFEEAIASFADKTGRPGPAGWELGAYPPGEDAHPVSGVSFYEAAAYAAFAGKSLPTVYQWSRAAGIASRAVVTPRSNFAGHGTWPAGRGAMNAYGTHDMAGNVKEWCVNESDVPGNRYIMGGGWNELSYMFIDSDAQPAWDRKPEYGFRCVKATSELGLLAASAALRHPPPADWRSTPPISDEVFRAYKTLFEYERRPLEPRVERTDDLEWARREKVTVSAPSSEGRLALYVFLPRRSRPPHQAVIFFPGSNARQLDRIEDFPSTMLEWMTSSGRAFVFPVYKGTFERRMEAPRDPNRASSALRDDVVSWTKEFSRAIDYVETRADLDASRLGFYGISWGATLANILLAVDARPKAAILVGGGFGYVRRAPEIDVANYAPRVTLPVLLMNGRFDHDEPVEVSQRPMFDALGTPPDRKRFVLFDSGHVPPLNEVVKLSIPWLDRWLGPVTR
jgi:eukaryotic-like serine/threonine-protein kinase